MAHVMETETGGQRGGGGWTLGGWGGRGPCMANDMQMTCGQVSILSVAIEDTTNLSALRSLRTLRALRPLRAISRWQGMKVRTDFFGTLPSFTEFFFFTDFLGACGRALFAFHHRRHWR